MKPAPFAYVAPREFDEVLEVLAEEAGDASVLAGGQSLLPLMAARELRPGVLVDVNGVADFPGAGESGEWGDGCFVGALDRQCDHERSAEAPLLAAALAHVGHAQTRHRGTVCGSLAHGDPMAEIPLALLVAGGSVEIASRGAARQVAVDDFLGDAFRPRVSADEVVTGCRWPDLGGGSTHSFVELQHGSTLGAAACSLKLSQGGGWSLRVGVAGFADRPRVSVVELDAGDLDAAADVVGDLIHSGPLLETHDAQASYRGALLGELGRRAIAECAGSLR